MRCEIMQITTVMVVILIVWCGLTLLERGGTCRRRPYLETSISRLSRSGG